MRKTDSSERTHFRSGDRIFQVNDDWWFGTREGDQGPFESRRAAQDALTQFVLDTRGDIELNEVSILDKSESDDKSPWNSRPDVLR